jgi:hypothetical protein
MPIALKLLIVATIAVAMQVASGADAAECKKGEVLRINTQGQLQCVNGKRTFADCVQGGMQLGYSQLSAQDYCRSKGLK